MAGAGNGVFAVHRAEACEVDGNAGHQTYFAGQGQATAGLVLIGAVDRGVGLKARLLLVFGPRVEFDLVGAVGAAP
jgi:hypothetical protein